MYPKNKMMLVAIMTIAFSICSMVPVYAQGGGNAGGRQRGGTTQRGTAGGRQGGMGSSGMGGQRQGGMGGSGMGGQRQGGVGGSGMGGQRQGGMGGSGMGGQRQGGMGGPGMGGPGGGNQAMITGSASYELDGQTVAEQKEEKSLILKPTEINQTALRVKNGAKLKVGELTVEKSGNVTNEEQSNFYSLNSAVAAWANSTLTLDKANIKTNASGANAIFAYGNGAHVIVKNLTIETTRNSSRGLDATYGGKIEAEDLTISTQGAHCAALATDRGEGFVFVKRANATTRGQGSPGIYSTGDIRAENSTFVAYGSEAAVIEGKNSIIVTDCDMTGNVRCGAMLYQSFSGDAGIGTSIFKMTGGKMTANVGPMFYITNTQARIELNNATLIKKTDVLVQGASDRWGTSGRNGGHLTMVAENQKLDGNILVNDISDVSLILKKDAVITGAFNPTGTAGQVNLSIADGAVWNVTADSYVDELGGNGGSIKDIISRIKSNGHTVYYRVKTGLFKDETTYELDNGGKLVYKAAPAVDYNAVQQEVNAANRRDGGRGPGGPMGGSNNMGGMPGGMMGGPGVGGMPGGMMGGPGMGGMPGGMMGNPGMGGMPPMF